MRSPNHEQMGRRGGYGARMVEQTHSIVIDELRRAGYVGTAPTNWWVYRNRLFCAGIQPKHWNDNTVTLDNQILRIRHVPWHFGGQRAYFLCDCGRRVGTLYRPPGHPWRCRKRYQLTYATRQAAPRQRLILKAQKVREQLGGKLGVLDVFPDKPKSMHWRRYPSRAGSQLCTMLFTSPGRKNAPVAQNRHPAELPQRTPAPVRNECSTFCSPSIMAATMSNASAR